MSLMSPPNETTKDLAAKVNRLKTLLALDELDTSRDDACVNLCQAKYLPFNFAFSAMRQGNCIDFEATCLILVTIAGKVGHL